LAPNFSKRQCFLFIVKFFNQHFFQAAAKRGFQLVMVIKLPETVVRLFIDEWPISYSMFLGSENNFVDDCSRINPNYLKVHLVLISNIALEIVTPEQHQSPLCQ
jgi:hypothetical protein